MKYKYVIWDFNGTILDDTGISINAINKVLTKRNLPTLDSLSALQEVFCFPVKEYYRRLGLDFSEEPYEIPADEWVNEYTSNMLSAKLMDGVSDALKKIENAGIKQIVLSASELDMLKKQVDSLGIAGFFEEILGCDNVYAGGKTHIAAEWIKNKKEENVFPAIMIGDTDHDFEVAQKIGCDCVLYAGGFMSKNRLLRFGVPVFDSFSDIVSYITD